MLETEAISYQIGPRIILQNISLSFPKGRVFGIVGPNGSGKSTLLKMLTGIWKPTQGIVRWQGENLLKKAPEEISKTIAFVPQNPPIGFDFTVWEIVAMGRYPHGSLKSGEGQERIQEALRLADVWHLRERLITQVSTGERQRVYIARALATEAPILALDEPTSNLDIRHQLGVWELLRNLAQAGKVVISTLHDLHAAERFCDQLAVLHQGTCVSRGAFAEALPPHLLHTVFGVMEGAEKNYAISLMETP